MSRIEFVPKVHTVHLGREVTLHMTLGVKAVIGFWLAAVGWSTWHRKDGQTLSEGVVWLLRHRWLRLPTATVIVLTLIHIVSMTRSNSEMP